ncbi:glycerophosphoryl diester phosphodiesterase membrane domain-containing protein [Georgenia sp. Z1344]|uniref:glycerophosphoryl diester phosphodiesterase membrane domain-containing protein n=1 Tax=Georgenia sp. Z1344 TaxID=3416706 RepID=UPI003CE7DFC2
MTQGGAGNDPRGPYGGWDGQASSPSGDGDPGGYGQYGADPTAPVEQPPTGQYGQYGAGPTAGPPAPGAWGAPGGTTPGTASSGYGQYGAADAPGSGAWVADSLAGGRPGIIALRPLGVGEILEGAFRSVRHNPGTMFFYAGVVSVLTLVLSLATSWLSVNATQSMTIEESAGVQGFSSFALGIVTALTSLIATGALVVSVSRSAIGKKASIGEVWTAVKGRILSLVGLSLLLGLIMTGLAFVTGIIMSVVAFAFLAAVIGSFDGSTTGITTAVAVVVIALLASSIPAIIIMIRLSLSYPAVVLEKAGPGRALSRSWSLTSQSTWRLVGVYLLTAIIAIVIAGVVSLPVGLLGGAAGLSDTVVLVLTTVVSVLVNLIITPFTAGVTSLVYIDQRMRREGLDVQLARAASDRA